MELDGSSKLHDPQSTATTGGGGGGGVRSKLSLRRKKDHNPLTHHHSLPQCDPLALVAPTQFKSTITTSTGEADKERKAGPPSVKETGLSNDAEFTLIYEESEEEEMKDGTGGPSSAHPSDDGGGLGDLYFCHICQKDLTRFSESRRQTHINRCCDKQQEEESLASRAAAARERQSSALTCLLCEKNFRTEDVRLAVKH